MSDLLVFIWNMFIMINCSKIQTMTYKSNRLRWMEILRCINLNISWKFGSIEIRKCQSRLTLTDEQNSSQEDSCIKMDLTSRQIKGSEKSCSIGINCSYARKNGFVRSIVIFLIILYFWTSTCSGLFKLKP